MVGGGNVELPAVPETARMSAALAGDGSRGGGGRTRLDPAAFARTAKIALTFGVIRKPAKPAAYTQKIWERAAAR